MSGTRTFKECALRPSLSDCSHPTSLAATLRIDMGQRSSLRWVSFGGASSPQSHRSQRHGSGLFCLLGLGLALAKAFASPASSTSSPTGFPSARKLCTCPLPRTVCTSAPCWPCWQFPQSRTPWDGSGRSSSLGPSASCGPSCSASTGTRGQRWTRRSILMSCATLRAAPWRRRWRVYRGGRSSRPELCGLWRWASLRTTLASTPC
mmetsp:Transcript_5652/g.18043  ORF Transcript_5652/g.18043 Transcript_5652/m.18043 type:complete len:206 (-) Transcript_5652:125-742(-)